MQSMQLTKEQLQDKIFELEMELKELQELKDLAYPDCYEVPEELEHSLQETICYIQYYKFELQYIEDLKYE